MPISGRWLYTGQFSVGILNINAYTMSANPIAIKEDMSSIWGRLKGKILMWLSMINMRHEVIMRSPKPRTIDIALSRINAIITSDGKQIIIFGKH